MKKLLFIVLMLISFTSFSQGNWTLSGAKNRWAKGIGFNTIDTTLYSNASDTILMAFSRAGRPIFKYLTYWYPLAVQGDTLVDGRWVRLQTGTMYQQVGKSWVSDTVRSGKLVRAPKFYGDSLQATGSGGAGLYANGGSLVAAWGGGGGTQFVTYGFSGYNSNLGSGYTSRSFTDKNYVDSSLNLKVNISDTSTMLSPYLRKTDTTSMLSKLTIDRVLQNGSSTGRSVTLGAITATTATFSSPITVTSINVSADIQWTNNSGFGLKASNGTTRFLSYTTSGLVLGSTGSAKTTVQGNGGNVLIGTTTDAATGVLQVTGNTALTGTLSVSSSSEFAGQGRFKGWYSSGSGLGLEVGVSSGVGSVSSYNRTSSAYADLNLSGTNVIAAPQGGTFQVSGNSSLSGTLNVTSTATAANLSVTGNETVGGNQTISGNTIITGNFSANGFTTSTTGTAFYFGLNTPILPQYLVSTLPTPALGMICYVTDALAPTYNAVVVGGGAVKTLVVYNGTNWTCH